MKNSYGIEFAVFYGDVEIATYPKDSLNTPFSVRSNKLMVFKMDSENTLLSLRYPKGSGLFPRIARFH